MKPIISQLFCFLLITCGILAWNEQQGVDVIEEVKTAAQLAREDATSYIEQQAALADSWLFEQFPNPDVNQTEDRQTQ